MRKPYFSCRSLPLSTSVLNDNMKLLFTYACLVNLYTDSKLVTNQVTVHFIKMKYFSEYFNEQGGYMDNQLRLIVVSQVMLLDNKICHLFY